MFRKLTAICALAFASYTAQATVISYNGYERNTAENYVSGGDLDWLTWDKTKGMSISEALAANAGWRLASFNEMTSMLARFALGGATTWTNGTNVSTPWAAGYDTGYEHFVDMFGETYVNDTSFTLGDPSRLSRAIFSSVGDSNLYLTTVGTDSYFWYTRRGYYVTWGAGAQLSTTNTSSNLHQGVALVRNSAAAAPVNAPASVGLFGLALCGLVARRKFKE